MKFKLKCKVCGEELPEGSNLLKHILKHPAILYFDTIPDVAWVVEEKKSKPTEEEGED